MNSSSQYGSFTNKVVVVTGASAGVGRATALEFARRGAQVALLARGQEGLDSAKREIELAGGQRLFALASWQCPRNNGGAETHAAARPRRQRAGELGDHQRPDNLFEPVAGDPGTHGRFDARAQDHSAAVWVVEQRQWLLLATLSLGALLWAAMRRVR